MPDTPDHLDPKEATEAKLCAYLENELPANERAEIEQHLAANPQHRKLLADLAQTRDWMRALPAESAPGDLAEGFQGQVERTMLLEDPDGRSMTIIRWPQLAMMAAIILLTAGLGVTLFIILRGPASRNLAIAPVPPTNFSTPQATQPVASALSAESADRLLSPVAPAAAPAVVATTPPVAMAKANVVTPTAPLAAAAPTAVPTLPVTPAADDAMHGLHADPTPDQIKTELIAAGYRPMGDVKSVCFVVRSDTPAVAVDDLHGFFARHQLVLEQPAGLANVAPQVADERRFGGSVVMKNLQNSANAELQQNQVATAQNGVASANGPIQAPAAAVQDQAPAAAANNSANTGALANNTTQPVVISTVGYQAAKSRAGNMQDIAATQGVSTVTTGDSFPQYFVAHNVTPLQVELLNASLAAANPTSTISRIALAQGPAIGSDLIAKGQTLIITVPQLVGPGMDKTNAVKVADDGTIILPMLDALPAAGVTMDELQQRIVTRYHDANLIPNATVSIATPPSTQPGLLGGTLPATMPMGLVPTTNPIAATTQPASGIDVVVLVEKSDNVDKAK